MINTKIISMSSKTFDIHQASSILAFHASGLTGSSNYTSFKNCFSTALQYCAQATQSYDESHDIQHHYAVALNIVELLNYQQVKDHKTIELQVVAAIIHDIVDRKYCHPMAPSQPTLETKREQLVNFLCELFSENDVARILLWVENSSFSKENRGGYPDIPEVEHVCRDRLAEADRWEAVNVCGIDRMRSYRDSVIMPDDSEERKIRDMVKHCEEKLLILDQFCYSELGKARCKELIEKNIKPWYDKHKVI